jgi:hypothetical protein
MNTPPNPTQHFEPNLLQYGTSIGEPSSAQQEDKGQVSHISEHYLVILMILRSAGGTG